MRVTRFDATLTYGLAAVALWISYTALADLALRAGLGTHQAAAWPLVVDGLILAATRAVVSFGRHDARRYAWKLLGCAAAASIVANAAHALLPPGPVHPLIAAVVAVVPPVGALAMTHLAVMRARVRHDADSGIAHSASPQVEVASANDVPASFEVRNRTQETDQTRECDPQLSSPDAPPPPAPDGDDSADAPVGDVRQRVLDLYEAGELSGRAIAKVVGVSEVTVRRYRDAARAQAAP